MNSVLKGLTFAVLAAGFGLSMVPSASADVLLMQPAIIPSAVTAGDVDTSVRTLPAVIDTSSTILTHPAVIDSSCGTCHTLVQPAVIDNGCNTCGSLSGSAVILQQPMLYGGVPFYGYPARRRGLFGLRLF